MRRLRWALGLAAGAALGACSDPPGTLELTVDNVPALVRDSTVLIAGSITRTPAKNIDITVTATGGSSPAADTLRGNRFSIRVRLNLNATNQIAISATDASGSSTGPLTVTVRQDGQAPAVSLVTPLDTTDNVATNAPIQVTFSEAVVVASGGGIRLSRQGAQVAGATAVSTDSLKLTFTPAAPLSPNAIYRLALSGITDAAANPVSGAFSSCFATTATGASAGVTILDSPGDTIYTNQVPGPILPPDLVSARFAREGVLFSGIFRFVGPRVFSATANNQGGIILELDTDQDSTTGYWTIKDTLFASSPSLGPSYSSGTRSEYIVDLEPIPEANDSAIVGRKSGAFTAFIDGAFLPGVCGPLVGFVLPFAILGNDDGNLHAVAMGIAGSATQILVDPMPTRGHLVLNLPAPAPAPVPAWAVFVAPGRGSTEVRLPAGRHPLR